MDHLAEIQRLQKELEEANRLISILDNENQLMVHYLTGTERGQAFQTSGGFVGFLSKDEAIAWMEDYHKKPRSSIYVTYQYTGTIVAGNYTRKQFRKIAFLK